MMSSHVETKTPFVPSSVGTRAFCPLEMPLAVSESVEISKHLRGVPREREKTREGERESSCTAFPFIFFYYMRKWSSCDSIN